MYVGALLFHRFLLKLLLGCQVSRKKGKRMLVIAVFYNWTTGRIWKKPWEKLGQSRIDAGLHGGVGRTNEKREIAEFPLVSFFCLLFPR